MLSSLAISLLLLLLFFNPKAFALSQEELIAGAKREGQLLLYTSVAAPQAQMSLGAFQKKYPFIRTEYYRTGKVQLLSRVLLEQQAKKSIADVIHSSVIQINIMKKKGALSRYIPSEAASYPSQYKDPDGYWSSVYVSSTVMGYNSRQVSRAEAPKKYEDLLQARWKSSIGIDSNQIEWFAMLVKVKGRPFMEKLAAQRPQVRTGNELVVNLLAAGEFPIAAGILDYSIEGLKNQGASVEWVALEPVITHPVGVALPSHPLHPYAGKLFAEFLLSKEGQEVVNQYRRVPIREDVESKHGRLFRQYELLIVDPDLGEREAEATELFRRLFQ